MTAPSSLTRNGWGSLHPDPDNKTVLSGHGHRVRVEVAQDWTEINHYDADGEEGYQHMLVLRTGSVVFTGFGNSQKEAREWAVKEAKKYAYEPRSCN